MSDREKDGQGSATPEQVREGEQLIHLFSTQGGKVIRQRFENQIAESIYRLITDDLTEQQILMVRAEITALGRALESMGDDMTTAMQIASMRASKQLTREALRR